jgi:hemoglobin
MSEASVAADAESVGRGVTLFMQRMTDDPLLSWAFAGIDRDAVQRHAFAFVIAALGGPDLYIGRDMRAVHATFQLENRHFDAAVVHLVEALREAGIAESVIAELAVRLEPLRSQIVTRS